MKYGAITVQFYINYSFEFIFSSNHLPSAEDLKIYSSLKRYRL